MTAEEIRSRRAKTLLIDSDSEFWLLEIAAQLAELNETLRSSRDALVKLEKDGINTYVR